MNEAAGGNAPRVHIPTAWLYDVAPRRTVGLHDIYQYPSIFDNGKAARDLGFRTTVPLVETFRRQIAWMEKNGKGLEAEEDPFQDVLIEAFSKDRRPNPESFKDFNPWGNNKQL